MKNFMDSILAGTPSPFAIAAFDLNTGEKMENGIAFPIERFESIYNVEEFDVDDLELNSEGNADGEIFIFFNSGETAALRFENFSPLVLEYNSSSEEVQEQILSELLEDIKANIDLGI